MNILIESIRAAIKAVPGVRAHLSGYARWIAATGQAAGEYKTYEFYLRNIERLVNSVYRGDIAGEFIDIMANLVQGQMTRAWAEGLKEAGYTPDAASDAELERIILAEWTHVDQFYRDIVDARIDETPIDPLLVRAEIWADRYNDVTNRAILFATPPTTPEGEPTMLVWRYNPEKEHCDQCASLDGIIAGYDEWRASGYHPYQDWDGNLPNEYLGCGGWRCGCELLPTDEPRNVPDGETLTDWIAQRVPPVDGKSFEIKAPPVGHPFYGNQWVGFGGGGSGLGTVNEMGRETEAGRRIVGMATALGFPENKIILTKEKYNFTVDGVSMTAGGSYNPATGEIKIYENSIFIGDKKLESLIAHEVQHDVFNRYEKQMIKEHGEVIDFMRAEFAAHPDMERSDIMYWDGRLKPPYDKQFPAYTLGEKISSLDQQEFKKFQTGVTEYSDKYWREYKTKKENNDQYSEYYKRKAINETLAEIAGLQKYGKPLSGRGGKVHAFWKDIYDQMKDINE